MKVGQGGLRCRAAGNVRPSVCDRKAGHRGKFARMRRLTLRQIRRPPFEKREGLGTQNHLVDERVGKSPGVSRVGQSGGCATSYLPADYLTSLLNYVP